MASISKSISSRVNENGYSQVLFRITINHDKRIRFKTNVFVPVKQWDNAKGDVIVPKVYSTTKNQIAAKQFKKECQELKNQLDATVTKIIKLCDITDNKNELDNDWFDKVLPLCNDVEVSKLTTALLKDRLESLKPSRRKSKNMTFFDYMNEYLNKGQFSSYYIKNTKVLMRILARYEGYQQMTDNKNYHLDINKLTKSDVEDIRNYIRDEYSLSGEHPNIFDELLKKYPVEITIKHISPKLVQRGENSIIKLMKKFKAFYNWMNDNDYTKNRPLDGVTIGTEIYGTPYYITLDERNHIADYDLSEHPSLAKQRDVFVFQCLIGCRVGDLLRMTNNNIVDGHVEYMPNKIRGAKPITVSVPLNNRAKTILERYHKDNENAPILPFISAQRYNDAIKEVFTKCGITRIVTILNPTNGEEEQRPINEIASSHMARRTFIGNLYRQVQDPAMIGKLSGHAEGSKAFARYRDIDEQMKVNMVEMLE